MNDDYSPYPSRLAMYEALESGHAEALDVFVRVELARKDMRRSIRTQARRLGEPDEALVNALFLSIKDNPQQVASAKIRLQKKPKATLGRWLDHRIGDCITRPEERHHRRQQGLPEEQGYDLYSGKEPLSPALSFTQAERNTQDMRARFCLGIEMIHRSFQALPQPLSKRHLQRYQLVLLEEFRSAYARIERRGRDEAVSYPGSVVSPSAEGLYFYLRDLISVDEIKDSVFFGGPLRFIDVFEEILRPRIQREEKISKKELFKACAAAGCQIDNDAYSRLSDGKDIVLAYIKQTQEATPPRDLFPHWCRKAEKGVQA